MTAKLAKRFLLAMVALGLLWYGSVCAYMWGTQREQIFQPRLQMQTTPERIGLRYEEVHIPSGSGPERGDVYGWWLPAERSGAPTVLYLHGNDKNISHGHDLDSAGRLHAMGYNVLMVDYRGYGKSTGGPPSEAKVYEDAEAVWNYLLSTRHCLPQRTFIYGHSLGGAIAIDLAVHHPEAAGLITESTFTTMAEMGKRRYEYLPVDLFLNQYFDSLGKIDSLKVPVLLIHGTWDRNVPYQMSEELYAHAPQPKYLKLVEGGEHSNISSIAWLEYRDAISAFVQKYAR